MSSRSRGELWPDPVVNHAQHQHQHTEWDTFPLEYRKVTPQMTEEEFPSLAASSKSRRGKRDNLGHGKARFRPLNVTQTFNDGRTSDHSPVPSGAPDSNPWAVFVDDEPCFDPFVNRTVDLPPTILVCRAPETELFANNRLYRFRLDRISFYTDKIRQYYPEQFHAYRTLIMSSPPREAKDWEMAPSRRSNRCEPEPDCAHVLNNLNENAIVQDLCLLREITTVSLGPRSIASLLQHFVHIHELDRIAPYVHMDYDEIFEEIEVEEVVEEDEEQPPKTNPMHAMRGEKWNTERETPVLTGSSRDSSVSSRTSHRPSHPHHQYHPHQPSSSSTSSVREFRNSRFHRYDVPCANVPTRRKEPSFIPRYRDQYAGYMEHKEMNRKYDRSNGYGIDDHRNSDRYYDESEEERHKDTDRYRKDKEDSGSVGYGHEDYGRKDYEEYGRSNDYDKDRRSGYGEDHGNERREEDYDRGNSRRREDYYEADENGAPSAVSYCGDDYEEDDGRSRRGSRNYRKRDEYYRNQEDQYHRDDGYGNHDDRYYGSDDIGAQRRDRDDDYHYSNQSHNGGRDYGSDEPDETYDNRSTTYDGDRDYCSNYGDGYEEVYGNERMSNDWRRTDDGIDGQLEMEYGRNDEMIREELVYAPHGKRVVPRTTSIGDGVVRTGYYGQPHLWREERRYDDDVDGSYGHTDDVYEAAPSSSKTSSSKASSSSTIKNEKQDVLDAVKMVFSGRFDKGSAQVPISTPRPPRTRTVTKKKITQIPKFYLANEKLRASLRSLRDCPVNVSMAHYDVMSRITMTMWPHEMESIVASLDDLDRRCGLEEITNKSMKEVIQIAYPGTQLTFLVGAGGIAQLDFDPNLFLDIVVKNVSDMQSFNEIHRGLMKIGKVRKMDVLPTEPHPLRNHPHLRSSFPSTPSSLPPPPGFEPLAQLRMSFNTARDAEGAMDDVSADGVTKVERLPRALQWGAMDGSYVRRECVLEFKWERIAPYRLEFVPLIWDEEVRARLDKVLTECGDPYFSPHYCTRPTRDGRNVVVEMKIPTSPYPIKNDQDFLCRLLEENGIAKKVNIKRSFPEKEQIIADQVKREKCIYVINKRIFEAAIYLRVWGGFHPTTEHEKHEMLMDKRFPWSVYLTEDNLMRVQKMNSCTVVFSNFTQGERIATYMQRTCPSEDFFNLNQDDRKGVFAYTRLRVHYDVPRMIRSLLDKEFSGLDEEMHNACQYSSLDVRHGRDDRIGWSRIVEPDDAPNLPVGHFRVVIEGFPAKRVDEDCEKLVGILNGHVIRCDDDEGLMWLLTGIGRNMANCEAKQALHNNVIVDMNVVMKEIRLFGEKSKVRLIESNLRKIAANRSTHQISIAISLTLPNYSSRLIEAINYIGVSALTKFIGDGCMIIMCPHEPEYTLQYDGSIEAYEKLKAYLVYLDDQMRESALRSYDELVKTKPDLPKVPSFLAPLKCPICLDRVSDDFYRLEGCGHVYCMQCIARQLSSDIAHRTFPFTCKTVKCGKPIVVADIIYLLIGDTDAPYRLAHLDGVKLRPLVAAIAHHVLASSGGTLIPCKTTDCIGILKLRKDSARSTINCKSCARQACSMCGHEPHGKNTCDQYERIRSNVEDSLTEYARSKSNKLRKCPNQSCAAIIEKEEGCNHMECANCRTHFCWLCCFASETQGAIYKHMQEDHGGNGLMAQDEDEELFLVQMMVDEQDQADQRDLMMALAFV